MRQDEAREIAREAAREALREFFVELGIDHVNPLEMQRDFQFLRDARAGTEAVKRKSVLTLLGIVLTGGVALIVMGVKQAVLPPG